MQRSFAANTGKLNAKALSGEAAKGIDCFATLRLGANPLR
jgi:hypothetical protein